jgi:hypothetical protein
MPGNARPSNSLTAESKPPISTTFPPHEEDHLMDLMSLVITLIVVGVLLWLVNNYIPMDGQIKRILNGVVVVAVIIWLLNAFRLLDSIRGIRVGS